MGTEVFLLYESASGYALFERRESEEVTNLRSKWQKDVGRFDLFSLLLKLKAYFPFSSKEMSVENVMTLAKGKAPDELLDFLRLNLPKTKSKKKKHSAVGFTLGVADAKLASDLSETLKVQCEVSKAITELMRGIRMHFHRFVKDIDERSVEKAQMGLAHSYSNSQIKFNLNRQDKMIIQAVSWLEQLDKDINSFAMRVKEIYSIHFPELVRLVSENETYIRAVLAVQMKENCDDATRERLNVVMGDESLVDSILDTAASSFGCDIEKEDLDRVLGLAQRTLAMIENRKRAQEYLSQKMESVAPNLKELLGELVGGKLIAHAGSLSTLAKYPASTVQILGAEKALFRAIKTRGKTPKYGLLYGSAFIGKASKANKGRISRYLANKCSMASRIDCFSEGPTVSSVYGVMLRDQVNERLEFYSSGKMPRKNVEVMDEASKIAMKERAESVAAEPTQLKKKRRRKATDEGTEKKRKRKDKKDKKKKKHKHKKKD